MRAKKYSTAAQVLAQLYSCANTDKVAFKATKFGINATGSLGVMHAQINEIIKQTAKSNELALELYNSGVYEAKLICGKIFNHKDLSSELMEKWLADFDNWEIVDTFCMQCFSKSELAIEKAHAWSSRTAEFEKRAGFVLMASMAVSLKQAPNELFEQFYTPIIEQSGDERIYVKKAVNWAIRQIGKRNHDLKREVIEVCAAIKELNTKAGNWIVADALKELTGNHVKMYNHPRSIYG